MILAPIQTERLHLRCVAPQDAAATAALMTQAVSEWLAAWPLPCTPQMARQRIETAREAARRKEALTYAITLQDDGKLIGWIGLARCETSPRRAALSYWLGADYHGRGFAREALSALLEVGFSLLQRDVIEAGA
ncbi:hypothetical protein GCM10010909_25220 [Acidocella aquatica]|uniref:N-acetyltransferase domain-containing protein n=1 Tax=Acidocella aquatica TaxID=1922313 RepID=A0ABQ6A7J4_9PROT|nr:GNAT family N-acetyltransferase [Acidocella aquatica]GLR67841.1 hypothetical protein GCM10010909_25220 [Acidocella aquatica]